MALALKIKIEKDEGVGVGLVKKKAMGMQEVSMQVGQLVHGLGMQTGGRARRGEVGS